MIISHCNNNSNDNNIIIRYSIRPSLAVNSWRPLWVRLQDKTTGSTDRSIDWSNWSNWSNWTNWSNEPIDQLKPFNFKTRIHFNSTQLEFLCVWKNKTDKIRFILWPIHSFQLIWHQTVWHYCKQTKLVQLLREVSNIFENNHFIQNRQDSHVTLMWQWHWQYFAQLTKGHKQVARTYYQSLNLWNFHSNSKAV